MKKNNFFKIAILSSFIANVYANEDINTLQNISYNDNGNKFRIEVTQWGDDRSDWR